ncbi:NUDIX hydrolase [Phycicoccus elongatus]|uniref:NUDIX hydrolase n=1 Tax=Phycicoccus elongatus TaxID=101689 RepID=UPI0037834BD3
MELRAAGWSGRGGRGPRETARREILEETGHEVDSIEKIATFEPMIGMVSSPHHVFLARGARRTTEPTEVDEGRFAWVPVSETQALITEGRVRNSGSLVGLLALSLKLR